MFFPPSTAKQEIYHKYTIEIPSWEYILVLLSSHHHTITKEHSLLKIALVKLTSKEEGIAS
jgi:hypothetical protein